jgi:hypothetical protein
MLNNQAAADNSLKYACGTVNFIRTLVTVAGIAALMIAVGLMASTYGTGEFIDVDGNIMQDGTVDQEIRANNFVAGGIFSGIAVGGAMMSYGITGKTVLVENDEDSKWKKDLNAVFFVFGFIILVCGIAAPLAGGAGWGIAFFALFSVSLVGSAIYAFRQHQKRVDAVKETEEFYTEDKPVDLEQPTGSKKGEEVEELQKEIQEAKDRHERQQQMIAADQKRIDALKQTISEMERVAMEKKARKPVKRHSRSRSVEPRKGAKPAPVTRRTKSLNDLVLEKNVADAFDRTIKMKPGRRWELKSIRVEQNRATFEAQRK